MPSSVLKFDNAEVIRPMPYKNLTDRELINEALQSEDNGSLAYELAKRLEVHVTWNL